VRFKDKTFLKIVFNIFLMFSLVIFGQTDLQKQPSQELIVSQIVFIGNKRTKEFVIRREMNLNEGDSINVKQLKNILEKNRNRIFNSGLFIDVQLKADTTYQNSTKIYVLVKERLYTIPNLVFELADRNFNEWWYQRGRKLSRTNYGIGLQQHNIRGRNETFKINLQGGFTKNLSASYSIPFLNSKKTWGMYIGGGYSSNIQTLVNTVADKQVFYKSDKTIFEKYYFSWAFTYRQGFFSKHLLSYDYNLYKVSDSLYSYNAELFKGSNKKQFSNSLKYKFTHDTRNLQNYATKGLLSVGEIKLFGLLNSEYYRNIEVALSHSRFYQLPHNFFISNKTKVQYSPKDQIPYYNLKAIGYGSDYLRGYDLYVIDASSYLYNKLTLKKRILHQTLDLSSVIPFRQFQTLPISIFLNGYADIGYGYKKTTNSSSQLLNRSLEGYGLGIDVVTFYDVVLRTEYSFNELGQQGLFFYVSTDVSF
jgi:outer membrane protein assembly factor BamA